MRKTRKGNYARYTSEKPLFGKYTGVVYRPEHDVIDKDLEDTHEQGRKDNTVKQKSIYLAGKISKHDYRHRIIRDLRGTFSGNCNEIDEVDASAPWPVLPKAVFGLDYTGPYFVSDDHGCFHGPDSHGFGAEGELSFIDENGNVTDPREPVFYHNSLSGSKQLDVIRWCTDAIRRSDIFFAWIEDTTCYGTLAELGYAKALGKIIWVAGTKDLWRYKDLWFACGMADEIFLEEWLNPSIAIQMLIAKTAHKTSAQRVTA